MRFSVLGPLRVSLGREVVTLPRPKSRALLALLLVRVGDAVPTEVLVDELWSGAPPPSAETALRVHLTHLRRSLAPLAGAGGSSPIERESRSYRLAIDPGSVDAVRFERMLAAAREAAAAGVPRETVDTLEGALASWHGLAYADVRDLERVRAEAVRLDQLRVAANEVLADALLASERPTEACAVLAPMIIEHPLREGLTARLMLALYRSGRQSDALAAYAALRAALDEQLGIPPSAPVRALEESIVLQRPDLAAVPLATHPSFPVRVADTTPFVGRRNEMAALERTWRDVEGGERKFALLSGAPGIGKTSLAGRLAAHAAAAGATVLTGSCDPDSASEYEPFPQILRAALEHASPDAVAPPVLAELALIVPWVVPDHAPEPPSPYTGTDPAAGRHRLFGAVTTLLSATGAGALLVIAEDLHWAGDAALMLLHHILLRATLPIMVVGTARDDETTPETPLADALGAGRLARPDVVLALTPLDDAEVAALIRAATPAEQRDRLEARATAMRELTGGNPLFVGEALHELAQAPAGVALDDIAPGGVRALAERRLARLSPPAQEALTVAALLGREFSLQLLAATCGTTEDASLAALDEGLAARLVVETERLDQFTFSHPLVRNAIYTGMSRSRRVRWHRRAGEALLAELGEQGAGRWAEPARHFLEAVPLGEQARAATYARRAGDDATARFAHAEAVTWYQRCVELAEPAAWNDARAGRTTLALGEALERAGRRDDAREAYIRSVELARRCGDHELLADAAIAATPRFVSNDAFRPTQLALVDEALSTLGDDERRRVLLLSCAGAARYYDEGSSDQPASHLAFMLSRESRDPEVVAVGLVAHHRWLTHDEHAAVERLAVIRELRDLCEHEQLDNLRGHAYRALIVSLLGLGELDEFDQELEVYAHAATTLSVPTDLFWVAAFRATRAMMSDPHGVAEELVRAAYSLGRELQQGDAEGTFILQTFALRYQQDRAREVTAGLEAPATEHPRVAADLALLAASFVAAGRFEPARAVLDQVAVDGELRLRHDNLWLAASALFGGVAAAVGTTEQRALFTDVLTPFGDRCAMLGAGAAVFGTCHNWLGRLAAADGRRADAVEHFTRATELCEARGAGYWASAARADLGALGTAHAAG